MASKEPKERAPRSPNATDIAAVALSACRVCQSTDRTPYENPREVESGGITTDGQPFTHVVWRTTACKNCGQARVDKTFENRIQ